MGDEVREGSSRWYAGHSARLLAQAAETKNPVLRAEIRKTAAKLRMLAQQSEIDEKKLRARKLTLSLR